MSSETPPATPRSLLPVYTPPPLSTGRANRRRLCRMNGLDTLDTLDFRVVKSTLCGLSSDIKNHIVNCLGAYAVMMTTVSRAWLDTVRALIDAGVLPSSFPVSIALSSVDTLRSMQPLRYRIPEEPRVHVCVDLYGINCSPQFGTTLARMGLWDMLQRLYDTHSLPLNEGCFASAAREGDVKILQWLRDVGCPWDCRVCQHAACHDSVSVLQWAVDHGASWDASCFAMAAQCGNFEVLTYCLDRECPMDVTAQHGAAAKGRIDVLEWLRERGLFISTVVQTCAEAASGGHLPTLQWLREQGAMWDEDTCFAAIAGGHWDVMRWALDAGCPGRDAALLDFVARSGDVSALTSCSTEWGHPEVTCETLCNAVASADIDAVRWVLNRNEATACPQACSVAANVGSIPILQLLLSRGCTMDDSVLLAAADQGDRCTLRWCLQRKPKEVTPSADAMLAATSNGRISCMNALRDSGCSWDNVKIAAAAVASGRLPVIKWALRHGAVMTARCCHYAAMTGDIAVIQSVCEHVDACDAVTCCTAAFFGHLHVLKWLRDVKGCAWDERSCNAAIAGGNFAILRYLKQKGCPWDNAACSKAALAGNLEVLKWLRSSGCPWDSSTWSGAVFAGHQHVVTWCESNDCPRHDEMHAIPVFL